MTSLLQVVDKLQQTGKFDNLQQVWVFLAVYMSVNNPVKSIIHAAYLTIHKTDFSFGYMSN